MNTVTTAIIVSLIAGLATGLGAIPLFFVKRVSHRLLDTMMGFAAGIMFSASVFSLILPGLEIGSLWEVVVGIFVGAMFFHLLNKYIPHIHLKLTGRKDMNVRLKQAILIGAAIAIHNIPEGFAVGVGYASSFESVGFILALAIAIHNIPEGLIIAAPLRADGVRKSKCFLAAAGAGLTQPVGAIIGIVLISLISKVLSFSLGFAAGAMIYIVSREMIPECHSHDYKEWATWALISGFIIMMILQYTL